MYVEREMYVCDAVDPVFWFILADSRGNVYGGAVGVDSFWEGGGNETCEPEARLFGVNGGNII